MMPPLPPRLKEYSDWVKTLPKEPLEVTLALSSPVLQEHDGFIHLDGMIYHAILSNVMQGEWAEGVDRGTFFLPIFSAAYTEADETGFKTYRHFYLASAAKFIDAGQDDGSPDKAHRAVRGRRGEDRHDEGGAQGYQKGHDNDCGLRCEVLVLREQG